MGSKCRTGVDEAASVISGPGRGTCDQRASGSSRANGLRAAPDGASSPVLKRRRMRILVVGTHPHVRQPSMVLFAGWLVNAVRRLGEVEMTSAPCIFLTASRRGSAASKWLAYLDQYVLLPFKLWARSRKFDLVVVADQGNAPSSLLTPRRKLMVMVHDTIAMRQALGRIPEAPRLDSSGVMLQALIRRSVRRARALLSNPGAVPDEIEQLELGRNVTVVGCPADYRRLQAPSPRSLVEGRYILNVASDGWRKRKHTLIPLWREVSTLCNLKLVLAGSTSPATYQAFLDAGLANVVVLNDISDQDLASLYKHCEALIVPSHEEGLCIPVLEALYFDKQVFTANVSPSYADFFGSAVTRLDLDLPVRAADMLLATLESSPDRMAMRRVQDWSQLSAFDERVSQALRACMEQDRPAHAQAGASSGWIAQ